MKFHEKPMVILNHRCNDPECGMLHPRFVDVDSAALLFFEDTNDILAAMIQHKMKSVTDETKVPVAIIMEVHSFGFENPEDPDEDRLCMLIKDDSEAMVFEHENVEELKALIDREAVKIFHTFMNGPRGGTIKLTAVGDDEDLEDLDPDEMFQA